MSSSSSRLILCLWSLVLLSCRELNALYCEDHPDDDDCRARIGGDLDACTSDSQCAHPTPVCDMTGSMCVQCTATATSACSGATPVCGAGAACRGCADDAECASLACLPDGACAAVGSVLYATPGGSVTAACMPAEPCALTRAIDLIDGTKVTIRLEAGRYELPVTLTLRTDLRLVGRGAVIVRDAGGTGATLAITDGAHIALDHVTIEGGDGDPTGVGIGCSAATLELREVEVRGNDAAGIHSTGCALALTRAQIVNNHGPGISATGGSVVIARSQIMGNSAGGLALTAVDYDLRNNVIARNGDPKALFGGVLISQIAEPATHVFDFNTVAHNLTTIGGTPGVLCTVVFTPLAFTNSIAFGNNSGVQVDGSACTWSYSDIGPVPASGTGNVSVDPQFAAPAQDDFHLQVSSPVRDAADPAATLAVDFDGDVRPQGAGRDMGADEIP